MKFIDNIVVRALDRIEPVINKQLTDFRTDAMTLLQNELPKIAGAVAESSIKAVFDHTNIDEAANDVSAVITDILDRIPFLNVGKH